MALCASIVYVFPKGGSFKYEFQKGLPWKHPTLYAPFDFFIYKTEAELAAEKATIDQEVVTYFRLETTVLESVKQQYQSQFSTYFPTLPPKDKTMVFDKGQAYLSSLYSMGILPLNEPEGIGNSITLVTGNQETIRDVSSFLRLHQLDAYLTQSLPVELQPYRAAFYKLFFAILEPNITVDTSLSQRARDEQLRALSPTKGIVKQGRLIIAENELVVGERYQLLQSLKTEYQSNSWSKKKELFVLLGYVFLIGLVLFMLYRFVSIYRSKIFVNNKQLTFILFNVWLITALTVLVLNFDPYLVYAVPLCILPLTLKTFFDARLGLFTHVLTVLLLGFVVPNSFEFIFLQILAGIVTIQTNTKLYQRANLFISVGQIVLIYVLVYVAFTLIHEGSLEGVGLATIALFLLNGLLTLFVQPLIYLFERLFGLTSDISLLELSDTNSHLLKQLSDKAPGTFHHSLQVANLAEAAAAEIGANTLLVRVGALYHDIGKVGKPSYFSENQKSATSPHHDLSPKQSASIIIDHVREGISLAKQNNLPERIIDFIRTHHGTSLVFYFYKQEQERLGSESINISEFKYPGPKPFSKETAILMMADAVEAASKSLKEPNLTKIEQFVQQIIQKQLDEGQFSNSNITLSEIERIKKVLIRKLSNVYQLRIEYPE